ncbi:PAS domain-containing sensor histidine kinase [Thermostichus vulcanus]|uniref:histidine kinase n=1 Tax=Thermostichus vulcanus str. 'Rupite' TaxID=2813851 RepID=A0ABT0C9F1_THEVL|nr:PAS domain S-box protein [Thermostichus vulcanus]MCJ2542422.1 PAS domain S-box protein [Thermostichus vulcanus str. 'Rupite']
MLTGFDALLENAPIGIFRLDLEGRCLFANSKLAEIYGYRSTAQLIRHLTDFGHRFYLQASTRSQTLQELLQANPQPSPSPHEFQIRNRQGQTLWVREQIYVVRSKAGDPLCFEGYVEDITAQKETEQALADSQARYQSLIWAIPEVLVILSQDGEYLELTYPPENAHLTSIPLQDFQGQSVRDLFTQDVADLLQRLIARCLATGSRQTLEYPVTTLNGEPRHREIRMVPYGSDRVLGLIRDITDRKQIELALLESQQRFWGIVESCNLGISLISLEAEAKPHGMNPALSEITGYSAEELRTLPLEAYIPDPADVETLKIFWQELVNGQRSHYELEHRCIRKDNQVIWVKSQVYVVKDENKQPLFAVSFLDDISDRKHIKSDLEKTKNQLEGIFNFCGQGIALMNFDPNPQYLSLNPAMAEITGYNEEDWLNLKIQDYTPHAEDQERGQILWEELISGYINNYEYEKIIRRKDGKEIWVHLQLFAVRSQQGDPLFILSFLEDISERKKAEIQLRSSLEDLARSEARYRALYEAIPDMLLQVDRQGLILSYKPPRGFSTVYESDCYLNRYVRDLFPEHWTVYFSSLLEQAFQTGQVQVVEYPLPQLSQGKIPEYREARLLSFGPDDAIVLVRDITLRKRLEAMQQAREAELQALVQKRTQDLERSLEFESILRRLTHQMRETLDESTILQTVVQELGTFLRVIFCDIGLYDKRRTYSQISYEYTTLETPGIGDRIWMQDFPFIYEQLWRGWSFQLCDLDRTRDPEISPPYLTKLACPIADDQGILGDLWLARPISESFSEWEIHLVQQMAAQCAIAIRQARLYLSSQAQVTELKKLNQLKDNFLATVSHELCTPLTNISLSIRMLKLSARTAPLDPKQVHYIEVLEQECEREISLINDFLELQKLDNHAPRLRQERLYLPTYLDPLIQEFRQHMQNRQQDFQVHWDPRLPFLQTDPRLLERVVRELLTNASKFTPAGGQIFLEALALDSDGSDELELRFTNTGVEIPIEQQESIFERFYRISQPDPWKHGGTGLGLALAREIANHLGGALRVESATHQTTFILSLPITGSC